MNECVDYQNIAVTTSMLAERLANLYQGRMKKSMIRRIRLLAWLLMGCASVTGNSLAQTAQAPPDAQALQALKAQKGETRRGASGLILPRFVTVSESKANVRRGPGEEYPLLWQYRRQGLPLEIIAEYQKWRRIRDHEGDEGWMHSRLLRGPRMVMVRSAPNALALKSRADTSAATKAYVQDGALGKISDCQGGWCEVAFEGHQGWLPRNQLWGLQAYDFSRDE